MADALTAEEEAHRRQCCALGGQDLRRVWATLDAARAERDEAREQAHQVHAVRRDRDDLKRRYDKACHERDDALASLARADATNERALERLQDARGEIAAALVALRALADAVEARNVLCFFADRTHEPELADVRAARGAR